MISPIRIAGLSPARLWPGSRHADPGHHPAGGCLRRTGNRIISRTRVEAIGFEIKDRISGDVFGTARIQISVV